jgi:hypothetical protein
MLSRRQAEALAEWLDRFRREIIVVPERPYENPSRTWRAALAQDVIARVVHAVDGSGAGCRARSDTISGLVEGKGAVGLPGPYRFYYLPRSRLVLSGDPLEAEVVMRGRHRVELAGVQARAGISSDDVILNRAGYASRRQRRLVRSDALIGVIGILALAIAGAVNLLDSLMQASGRLEHVGYGVALSALALGLGWAIRAFVQERRETRVIALDGTFAGVTFGYDDSLPAGFELQLDGGGHARFSSFDPKMKPIDCVVEHLVEGARYRVYCMRGAGVASEGRPLAIEPLPLSA